LHENVARRTIDVPDDGRIFEGCVDTDTSIAIDSLGAGLRAEMSDLRVELRGEMSELRGELRGEMSELRGEIADLRLEVRDGLAQNRRHTEILFETLRDDIRILAEGFAVLSTKIDSLQR
jgi:hypothetical protein